MRIPSDASIEVKGAFQDVYEALRPLRGRSIWKLDGRRVTGAGDAQQPQDLVTLRQARREFSFDTIYERLRQRGLDGFRGVLREPQPAIVQTPDSASPPPVTQTGHFFFEPDTGLWRYADGTSLITVSATGDASPETGTGTLLRTDGIANLTGAREVHADWEWLHGSNAPASSPEWAAKRSRTSIAAPSDVQVNDRIGAWSATPYLSGWLSIPAGLIVANANAVSAPNVDGELVFFISSSGVLVGRMGLYPDRITMHQPARGVDGTAAAPAWSYINSTGTGAYSSNSNELSFATNGLQRLSMLSTGELRSHVAGSVTNVSFGRTTFNNTGLYFPAANSIAIAANGSQLANFNATGIGVFGVTPVARATAYTQTYSLSSHIHPNMTSNDLLLTSTNTSPWGYSSQAEADSIQTEVNALRADVINLKQLVNAIINDHQAYGWFQ